MAIRPIFIPNLTGAPGTKEKLIDFKWHPGMAKSQKQKSITELHSAAETLGHKRMLEISSKSKIELGVKLSAFNLVITTKKKNKKLTVETAFQGSKVFSKGGPYKDLFGMDSLAAKKDMRLKESGTLTGFKFFDRFFPAEPSTFFYDWLYIKALLQNEDLANEVVSYDGFSDIEFNPKKSVCCQARSVAIYVSLHKENKVEKALSSRANFLDMLDQHYKKKLNIDIQDSCV